MRHTDTKKAPAVEIAFLFEALEPRRLMADAADIVSIEWQGQTMEMRQGEWIVGLTYPGSTQDEITGEWTFNGVHNYGTTPSAALKPAFAAAEAIGVEFTRYLGSENAFLIKVPDGVSFEQLNGALKDVPDFQYVNPNVVGHWFSTSPIVPIDPPRGPHGDLDIVPIDPPSGPRAELDIVSIVPPPTGAHGAWFSIQDEENELLE